MHVCQNCNKKAATVHVTEIVGNEKKEIHLCEDCARAKNIAVPTGDRNDLIRGLFETPGWRVKKIRLRNRPDERGGLPR